TEGSSPMVIRIIATFVVATALIQEARSIVRAGFEEDGAQMPAPIAKAFRPPPELENDLGTYKSPLVFNDGRAVRDAAGWRARPPELPATGHGIRGAGPPTIEHPRVEVLGKERRETFEQRRVRVEISPKRTTEGYVLVPDGRPPFPAMLVV